MVTTIESNGTEGKANGRGEVKEVAMVLMVVGAVLGARGMLEAVIPTFEPESTAPEEVA